MDANYNENEMARLGGRVNDNLPVPGIAVTGNQLEDNLRGQPPSIRAQLAAKFVSGELVLIELTSAQGARLVNTGPALVHRALGHPVRPPYPADMVSYIRRYGIERVKALIVQIEAVSAAKAAA